MGNRHVIFIHGVGEQVKGYSLPLWQRLWAGQDPGDAARHEVFYYDVFQDEGVKARLVELAARHDIRGRVGRHVAGSELAGAVDPGTLDDLADTVSQVLHFCLDPDVREEIIGRFKDCLRREVIEPEVRQGASPADLRITILGHSLGTVVGYLGCHEVLTDSELGLDRGVRFRNLYTLASPLALLAWVAHEIGLEIPYVTSGLSRPVRHNPATNADEGSILDWWSYRHRSDLVASLDPLRGDFLSNGDVAPFLFDVVHCDSVHAFSNYIEQAKSGITANI